MAANLEDMKRYLSEDFEPMPAEPVPAPAPPAPAQAAEPTAPQAPAVDPAFAAALASVGLSAETSLEDLANLASVGNNAVAKARENVKRLAVVALGQERGQAAYSMIDAADISLLNTLKDGFITMGVGKGLLLENGMPVAAKTVAGGDENQDQTEDAKVLQAGMSLLRDSSIRGMYSI